MKNILKILLIAFILFPAHSQDIPENNGQAFVQTNSVRLQDGRIRVQGFLFMPGSDPTPHAFTVESYSDIERISNDIQREAEQVAHEYLSRTIQEASAFAREEALDVYLNNIRATNRRILEETNIRLQRQNRMHSILDIQMIGDLSIRDQRVLCTERLGYIFLPRRRVIPEADRLKFERYCSSVINSDELQSGGEIWAAIHCPELFEDTNTFRMPTSTDQQLEQCGRLYNTGFLVDPTQIRRPVY